MTPSDRLKAAIEKAELSVHNVLNDVAHGKTADCDKVFATIRAAIREGAEWGFDEGLYVYGEREQVDRYTTDMRQELSAIIGPPEGK